MKTPDLPIGHVDWLTGVILNDRHTGAFISAWPSRMAMVRKPLDYVGHGDLCKEVATRMV